jgi:hypothetical protein
MEAEFTAIPTTWQWYLVKIAQIFFSYIAIKKNNA